MLDIQDFIKERGGDPEKIRESQRKRNAPVEIVDEIIAMFEDHRRSQATPYKPCAKPSLTFCPLSSPV